MKSHLKFIIILIQICTISSQFAEKKDDITVTAKRKSRVNSTSGSLTIIDIGRDYRDYADLAELLEKEAGIKIRRYGGLGSRTTISIRGSHANQVNIYIDGIPLNNAAFGDVNLSDLTLENIQRIEIYRSGLPGSLSGSAVGGAVNLITKKGEKSAGTRIKVKTGSLHTTGMSARSWGGDKLRWSLGSVYLQSDQDYKFHNDNGTPVFNTMDDRDDIRKNAWFNNLGLSGYMNYRIKNTNFKFLNDTIYRRHGVPGPGNNQTEKTKRKYFRETTAFGSDTRGFIIPELRLQSRLYYTEIDDTFYDQNSEFSSGASGFRARDQLFGLHLMPALYLIKYNQIIRLFLGAEREILHVDQRDNKDKRVEKVPTKFRNHTSVHLEDEINLLNKSLVINTMLKYEKYRDRFNEPNNYYSNENIMRAHRSDTEFSGYSMGFLIVPYKTRHYRLFVKANGATDQRVPNFLELFGQKGSIIGNSELRPEKSRSADFGPGLTAKIRKSELEISVIAFRKIIRDMILLIPNSQFTLRPDNIDAADIKGVELALKINLQKKIKFYMNYTYQKALNKSNATYLRDKYLPLQPMHESHSGFSWFNNFIEAGMEIHFVGAVFKDRTNDFFAYQERRWIYNIFCNWSYFGKKQRKKELIFGLEIKNIMNYRVEDIIGYPLPGRSVYATIKWKF